MSKRNISVELFFKALKNENSGQFAEAMAIYESALVEVKKVRFHNDLKNKIIDKIKVLHTLIEDANSRHNIK